MNAINPHRTQVDPEVWEDPVMRLALAVRDITTVYRLLQKLGYSQQRIAAMTGQSQPEVSAIIHGRQVMAYDVLSRIADGLGVPRGYMGLASTPEATQPESGRGAALARTRLAVLGLAVTPGQPPRLSEASVVHIDEGVITAGPRTWWVQPHPPTGQNRPEPRADLRMALPWAQVAEQVVEALTGRALVVHDPRRWAVLHAHLPDWQPTALIFTRPLARSIWPDLPSYDLGPLTHQVGIAPTATITGATTEVHALALLLLTLAHTAD